MNTIQWLPFSSSGKSPEEAENIRTPNLLQLNVAFERWLMVGRGMAEGGKSRASRESSSVSWSSVRRSRSGVLLGLASGMKRLQHTRKRAQTGSRCLLTHGANLATVKMKVLSATIDWIRVERVDLPFCIMPQLRPELEVQASSKLCEVEVEETEITHLLHWSFVSDGVVGSEL
ncbi:uncharacterized protein N7515_007072 [Penicillium bovifimosum]|uniref:Uncharacterized protein n=1 Tax=Penicillium bovifimosum TaxID=126998 RepID=A0A9W9GW90_9EURO|nr:uncharacterized protein N7515_007072 [Penicillium bovifimosum]KAJ5131033.1 hypothetical protein N7515_007072 [Penicillium bovifimosum]